MVSIEIYTTQRHLLNSGPGDVVRVGPDEVSLPTIQIR